MGGGQKEYGGWQPPKTPTCKLNSRQFESGDFGLPCLVSEDYFTPGIPIETPFDSGPIF